MFQICYDFVVLPIKGIRNLQTKKGKSNATRSTTSTKYLTRTVRVIKAAIESDTCMSY